MVYFFLVNKSINHPVKPQIFGAGSSKISPLRLNSSNNLLSFFAILLYFKYQMYYDSLLHFERPLYLPKP